MINIIKKQGAISQLCKRLQSVEVSYMGPAQQKNEKFTALFEHAGIGILSTDISGEIKAVNKYIQDKFGYSEQELLGQQVEMLIPQQYRREHAASRIHFTMNMENHVMGQGIERPGIRKDGTEFPVEITLGYYKENDTVTIMAFINDITRRKDAEELLKRQNADLEQKVADSTDALRMTVEQLTQQVRENELKDAELEKSLTKEKELSELKSRFVSIASHEFRTPLAGISAATYLLSKYKKEEEQPLRDRHIARIHSAITTLTELLDDFLSIDKIEGGPVTPVFTQFDISKMVEECMQDVQHMLRNGHKFNYEHKGANADACLDYTMLKHVLTNLLSNGVKYSPDESVVYVTTEKKGNKLILQVTDRGIGIPETDQVHLFKRFFRASNASHLHGTGLGLTIVKKYVELMGGKIEFTSVVNQGTTFTATFNTTVKAGAAKAGAKRSEVLP